MKSVITTMNIGNEVSEYYNEFTKIAGIDGVSKDAVKNAAKSNFHSTLDVKLS